MAMALPEQESEINQRSKERCVEGPGAVISLSHIIE